MPFVLASADRHAAIEALRLVNQLAQHFASGLVVVPTEALVHAWGAPITAKRVAQRLALLHLRPRQTWLNGRKLRGYRWVDCREAIETYSAMGRAIRHPPQRHAAPTRRDPARSLPSLEQVATLQAQLTALQRADSAAPSAPVAPSPTPEAVEAPSDSSARPEPVATPPDTPLATKAETAAREAQVLLQLAPLLLQLVQVRAGQDVTAVVQRGQLFTTPPVMELGAGVRALLAFSVEDLLVTALEAKR